MIGNLVKTNRGRIYLTLLVSLLLPVGSFAEPESRSQDKPELYRIGGELSGGTITFVARGIQFSLPMLHSRFLSEFSLYSPELKTSSPLIRVCHFERRYLWIKGQLIESPAVIEICQGDYSAEGICSGESFEVANASSILVRKLSNPLQGQEAEMPTEAILFEPCISL